MSVTAWIEGTKRVGMSIDELDVANGLNALHYAIIFKQREVVEALLVAGASADSPCRAKLSPLHLAVLSPFKEAVELLTSSRHGCADVDRVVEGSKWASYFVTKPTPPFHGLLAS